MAQSTVPDFFQEETEDALRAQVDWLVRHVGVDDAGLSVAYGVAPDAPLERGEPEGLPRADPRRRYPKGG